MSCGAVFMEEVSEERDVVVTGALGGSRERHEAPASVRVQRPFLGRRRIVFLTRSDRFGASSRYRTLQYVPFLTAQGIECEVAPFFLNSDIERIAEGRGRSLAGILRRFVARMVVLGRERSADLLFVEKEFLPFMPWCVEHACGAGRIPYIVDYDDATFHRYDENASRVVRIGLGAKIKAVMRAAEVVLAGNSYLAQYARNAGAERVEVFPTVVDLERYPPERPKGGPGGLRIGWIGSPSTVRYLREIERPLEKFCVSNGGRVVVIGAEPDDRFSFPTEYHRWSEAEEVGLLRSCDVGVMPLTDDSWSRGKCGLKLIQYMASFLPVVASPVGANADIVQPGVTGFLARTVSEWNDALVALATDRDLRVRMGVSGRARVEKCYSLQKSAPRLETIVSGLFARGRV